MKQLSFFTSINKNQSQYLTWRAYSKHIYNIGANDIRDGLSQIHIPPHHRHGKNTYKISDIINRAKEIDNPIVLLNSDIELLFDNKIWNTIVEASEYSLVIGNRYNYTSNFTDGKFNPNGIDFFVINKNLVVPNDDNFCIGLCGWDWWIPWLATKQNISITKIRQPFVMHKIHERNWTSQSYEEMYEYFCRITSKEPDTEFKQAILNNAMDI